ncbi:MAG TPA: STM3941 family protein [Bryobacteraceae bacterium]|nr:STM3941 family protein [Bryobacteraceae bacterium]
MDPVVIRSARGKYALLLLIAVLLTASGVLMAVVGSSTRDRWMGAGIALFFGAGVVLFSRELLRSGPRIVIDDQGIEDRTLGVGRIPWAEITGAYPMSVQGSNFICLELRNPELWTRKLNPLHQALVAANRKIGFTELSINLSGVHEDPARIHELIVKSIQANAPR